MALHIYNTLTRKKERFEPMHPQVVRIYTCGLTVYSPMHIGHARTYCFWDLLRRYLEYRGYHVLSVINYTDIDDRIMDAVDDQTGSVDIAEKVIATFRRDCRMLRIKDNSAYTRATDFIAGQIELVAQLLELGHAYVVEGEVFYDVASFPGYGKLSGKVVDELRAGASGRVEEDASRKRHPADFTLWKPSEPGRPSWETGHAEWPSGRPGWHLECSVMSTTLLGDHFDIHGGAVDNIFPHHENELAQSEPVCGAPWVRYWMHPEHLNLREEKMSKSLGNVITVPDLLERHGYDEVRWMFAMNHYRTRMAFSEELLGEAAAGYRKITKLLQILEEKLAGSEDIELGVPVAGQYASQRGDQDRVPRMRHYYTYGEFGGISEKYISRFATAMDDDLNTPQATAATFDYVNELYAAGIENSSVGQATAPAREGSQAGPPAPPDENAASLLSVYRCLARHLYVLGCEHPHEQLYPQLYVECFPEGGAAGAMEQPYTEFIGRLLELREEARKDKDFARADLIRDVLVQAGLEVEDTAQGPRWELNG